MPFTRLLFCPILYLLIYSKPPMCFIFCLFLIPYFILLLLYHSYLLPRLHFLSTCGFASQFPDFFLSILNQFSLLLSGFCSFACPSAPMKNLRTERQPPGWPTLSGHPISVRSHFLSPPRSAPAAVQENIKPVMSQRPKDSCWSRKWF